jgi:hypothetical protein
MYFPRSALDCGEHGARSQPDRGHDHHHAFGSWTQIDEKGAEAAAVTAIGVVTSAPVETK